MMRLRCTLAPVTGMTIVREVCRATRGSHGGFRRVGYGLTIAPSALLAATRAMTTMTPSSSHSGWWCGGRRVVFAPVCTYHTTLTLQARLTPRRGQHERAAQSDAQSESTEQESRREGGEGDTTAKGPRKRKTEHKFSFADHVRGLKNDYVHFPDIYNSANAINFIIFTVFCLCSTGSNTEEQWWMEHWALDNVLRPYNWLLHSFLTNNFLTMTYAMMMLHSMCHQVLPTIGSRALLLYVGSTAMVSGAVMWAGNRIAYGGVERAREKQFGPWDVVSAMFVMQYLYFGITPFTTLNSFNSWMRYACWVGQICVMYFDWQPTFVGAAVGLALCKGVPRFRAKPLAG